LSGATEEFDRLLQNYESLGKLQAKTGVPRVYLALAIIFAGSLILYSAFGPGLLCNLIGFMYPAYASFKAIETANPEDDKQWLTYWVVFAAFNIVEVFVDVIMFWFPFYYPFKFGFLIYCFLPQTQGAIFIYENVVQPFLKKHEAAIDSAAAKGLAKAAKKLAEAAEPKKNK